MIFFTKKPGACFIIQKNIQEGLKTNKSPFSNRNV